MLSGAVTNRYTQGLFLFAKGQDQVDAMDESLQVLADVLRSHPELQTILNHPLIPADAKVNAVTGVLKDLNPLVVRFLTLLLERGRGEYVVAIYERFHELAQEAKGEMTVQVESAMKLSPDQLAGIEGQLGKSLGKKVTATLTIDPNLIAGARIRVGDRVIDATVRGVLSQFSQKLVNGAVKEGTL